RNALAYATASEHEGFCVPVLEAMAFGTPVLARATAAIPETVADAALLIPPDAPRELYAEAIVALAQDDRLRAELVERGHRRVESFDATRTSESFLDALAQVV